MAYDLRNDQYPYPLNYLNSLGGLATAVYTTNDPTVLADSNNWYVLCLTPDELLNLLSVIEVGAPIAFPDDYMILVQKYMQMREFPNEIPEDSCMDLCQLIIDCINSTPELQELIARESNGAGVNGDSEIDTVIFESDINVGNVGCDDDSLFGLATGLVDLLNGIAVDVIEIWEDAVNAAARMGDFIEGIPIIGEAPVDDILQLTETLLQDLHDNYDAAYTAALRDEYRCDLFCIGRNQDCNLTVHDLFDYFNGRLTTPLVLTDVNSFIANMLTQSATGTSLVDAFNVFVIGTIAFGGDMVGVDLDRLITVVSSLYNDPDSDWTTLCADCGWDCVTDFAVTQGNFTFPLQYNSLPNGKWTTTVGIETTDQITGVGQWSRRAIANIQFATPVHIDTITMNYDYTRGGYSADVLSVAMFSKDGATYRTNAGIIFSAMTDGTGKTYQQVPNNDVDEIQLYVQPSRWASESYGGFGLINSVTIVGTGNKPTELICS